MSDRGITKQSFGMEEALEDIRDAQSLLRHIPKGAEKALTRAVNRTLTGTRAEAVRQVRGKFHRQGANGEGYHGRFEGPPIQSPGDFSFPVGAPFRSCDSKLPPKAQDLPGGKACKAAPGFAFPLPRANRRRFSGLFWHA